MQANRQILFSQLTSLSIKTPRKHGLLSVSLPCSRATVYTRKNAQVVTKLQQTCSIAVPTTCQQDVLALLVPSLLTSCQDLVKTYCKVPRLFIQQTCYKLFQQLVIVLQFNNLSTSYEWQSCSNHRYILYLW